MSDMIEVPAELRSDRGRVRAAACVIEGLVPAILVWCGQGLGSLQLGQQVLLHALEEESFYTSILELTVGDGRVKRGDPA